MSVRRLLIVRHPETEANVTGRWVGRGDAPYTKLGTLQATLLAEEIAAFEPSELWSSPLRRCREVAEKAGADLGLDPIYDDRLLEMDFGLAEGHTYDETVELGIAFDFKSEDAPVAPGGESRTDVFDRTARVLDEIISRDLPRVAVVTHGGVFRSTVPIVLGLPLSSIWSFHIANAGFIEYRIVDSHASVERFGQVSR